MPTHKVTFYLPTMTDKGLPYRVRAALSRLPIKGIEEDPSRKRMKVVYDADKVFLRQIYDVLEATGFNYKVLSVDKPAWDCQC